MITAIPPTAPIAPGTGVAAAGGAGATAGAGGGFGHVLGQVLSGLNGLEQSANSATQAMANGNSADLATAMVAVEKANLGLQLAVEARNRAVSAYQQLMQMPL